MTIEDGIFNKVEARKGYDAEAASFAEKMQIKSRG
jgi:hypothetical protein